MRSNLQLLEGGANEDSDGSAEKQRCVKIVSEMAGTLFAETEIDTLRFVLRYTHLRAADLHPDDLALIRSELTEAPEDPEKLIEMARDKIKSSGR